MTNLPPHPTCPSCRGPVIWHETAVKLLNGTYHRRCAAPILEAMKASVPSSATVSGIERDGPL